MNIAITPALTAPRPPHPCREDYPSHICTSVVPRSQRFTRASAGVGRCAICARFSRHPGHASGGGPSVRGFSRPRPHAVPNDVISLTTRRECPLTGLGPWPCLTARIASISGSPRNARLISFPMLDPSRSTLSYFSHGEPRAYCHVPGTGACLQVGSLSAMPTGSLAHRSSV